MVDLRVACLSISTGLKGISSERRTYESTSIAETALLHGPYRTSSSHARERDIAPNLLEIPETHLHMVVSLR